MDTVGTEIRRLRTPETIEPAFARGVNKPISRSPREAIPVNGVAFGMIWKGRRHHHSANLEWLAFCRQQRSARIGDIRVGIWDMCGDYVSTLRQCLAKDGTEFRL